MDDLIAGVPGRRPREHPLRMLPAAKLATSGSDRRRGNRGGDEPRRGGDRLRPSPLPFGGFGDRLHDRLELHLAPNSSGHRPLRSRRQARSLDRHHRLDLALAPQDRQGLDGPGVRCGKAVPGRAATSRSLTSEWTGSRQSPQFSRSLRNNQEKTFLLRPWDSPGSRPGRRSERVPASSTPPAPRAHACPGRAPA